MASADVEGPGAGPLPPSLPPPPPPPPNSGLPRAAGSEARSGPFGCVFGGIEGVGDWGTEGTAAMAEDRSWVLSGSGLLSCHELVSAFLPLSLPDVSLQQVLLS